MEEQNNNQASNEFNFSDYKEKFLSNVSETERESYRKTLDSVKDIDGALKGYVHAQKQFGKAVFLPEGEEPWDKVYDKLGRPKDPSEYNLQFEGYDLQDESANKIKQAAHKHGLTPKQLQGFLEESVIDISKSEFANLQKAEEEALNATKEYKEKTYGEKLEQIENLVGDYVKDQFGDEFDNIKSELERNSKLYDYFAKQAQGNNPRDGAQFGNGTGYQKSATERIDELTKDRDFFIRYDRGEPEAVKLWNDLREQQLKEKFG
jgi:hypothetical protein